jgi:hypothetical protein
LPPANSRCPPGGFRALRVEWEEAPRPAVVRRLRRRRCCREPRALLGRARRDPRGLLSLEREREQEAGPALRVLAKADRRHEQELASLRRVSTPEDFRDCSKRAMEDRQPVLRAREGLSPDLGSMTGRRPCRTHGQAQANRGQTRRVQAPQTALGRGTPRPLLPRPEGPVALRVRPWTQQQRGRVLAEVAVGRRGSAPSRADRQRHGHSPLQASVPRLVALRRTADRRHPVVEPSRANRRFRSPRSVSVWRLQEARRAQLDWLEDPRPHGPMPARASLHLAQAVGWLPAMALEPAPANPRRPAAWSRR